MDQELKKKLWNAADLLRAQMDAAEYKHIVLGLIFLKHISDTFERQRNKWRDLVSDPESYYFVSTDPEEFEDELEERDYYTRDNVFWVPKNSRWATLRDVAKQPDIGNQIDRAMTAIENENSRLRGKLDKRFGRSQLPPTVLGELIDLISTIGFTDSSDSSDVLGEVYEYFLGQFASEEGKRGGQFYTPSHIVKTLVAVLEPDSGRVYDPCCGSGGMFVQSERFVQAHGGKVDDISIYGQESNPTTWRLAAMNLAIRGFEADLGREPTDTFATDQFPDLKADFILANPPFNVSDWGGEKYESDRRWVYGRPPPENANFAWLQHILWKLSPSGRAGVVLAFGSMSTTTGGEGAIREAMVRGDVVEAMVALPTKLFMNVRIPACLWFLTKEKTETGCDRTGEVLFIDARSLGTLQTRVQRILSDEDIKKIADSVHRWRRDDGYEDIPGFCKSISLDEIAEHCFVLTPGLYIDPAPVQEDSEPFDEKMKRLVEQLGELQQEGHRLDVEISKNLSLLGFDQ